MSLQSAILALRSANLKGAYVGAPVGGVIADLSGVGNNLTTTGTVPAVTGPETGGTAAQFLFDGYASGTSGFGGALPGAWTILVCARAGSQTAAGHVLACLCPSSGSGKLVGITASDSLTTGHAVVYNDAVTAIWDDGTQYGSFCDGGWHITAITYDGTTLKLYQDGALLASKVVAVGTLTPAVFMLGAAVQGTVVANANARVSHSAYWNVALSLAELQSLTTALGTPTDTELGDARVWSAQHIGAFFHFGMQTFMTSAQESDPNVGTTPVNTFAPTAVDTGQWLDQAVRVGATYAAITTLHYGGWKLWRSANDGYGVAQTTWGIATGRDPVAEFVAGCRNRGMKVGLYYHVRNPHWEEAHPGWTFAQNKARVKADLLELLSNYGTIDYLWTDAWGIGIGYVDLPWAEILAYIYSLQPQISVVDNEQIKYQQHAMWAIYEEGTANASSVPASGNLIPAEWLQRIMPSLWMWHSDAAAVVASTRGNLLRSYPQRFAARTTNLTINLSPTTAGVVPTDQVAALSAYLDGFNRVALADLPELYAPLTDVAGSAVIDLANANNGTLTGGGTLGVTGNVTASSTNTALLFGGVNGCIQFGNKSTHTITGVVTMQAIVKPTSFPTSSVQAIVGKGYNGTNDGYFLHFVTDGSNITTLNVGSYDGSNHLCSYTVPGGFTSAAHAITAGYTGTRWEIWVDGTSVANSNNATGAVTTTGQFVIGAHDNNTLIDRFFGGTIERVKVKAVAPTTAMALAQVAAMTPPTLSSGAVAATGIRITATLSASGCTPASGVGHFAVSGSSGVTVNSWSISGTTLTIILNGHIIPGETVTLAYVRSNDATDIIDTNFNALAAFSGMALTNSSVNRSAHDQTRWRVRGYAGRNRGRVG